MGGFYGNITDTSKTTFSFDYIYTTRMEMDEKASSDGVFLGRYVLIDYDEAPIKGYAKIENNIVKHFYKTPDFTGRPLEGQDGKIYEDLGNTVDGSGTKFYKYIASSAIYNPLNTNESVYYNRFSADVNKYGRGFDSTVWVKRYDEQANNYKYAMIAELNAVVPTLHMVVDSPNTVPTTPYFDRDTTNIDYYLHMQGNYGNKIKTIVPKDKLNGNTMRSDETVNYTTAQWTVDETGYQVPTVIQKNDEQADIYYNNAGFDETTHNFSEGTVEYPLLDNVGNPIPGKTNTVNYSINQIGYDMSRSGRYYGASANVGVYDNAFQADDIYDWFIRLPGIGNSICKMWDKLYGYRSSDNKRYLNDALTYEDTDEHLVSYDRTTAIGVMNTAQDLIGYHFLPLDLIQKDGEGKPIKLTWESGENKPEDFFIKIDLGYEEDPVYDKLKCIFYATDNNNKEYYAYHYAPKYEPAVPELNEDKTAFADNKTYYYFENGIYHIANPKTYNAVNANEESIESKKVYYLATPQWEMSSIGAISDNSIQTLIAQIHTILGTNVGNVRDMASVQGAINIMKDIIANIDMNLEPGRLLHTNNSGIIETVKGTYFPSATWDEDKVLDGAGKWVSRFATVKILKNSDEDNQNNPEVNIVTDGIEQNVVTIIESDNDKSHIGTSLVNDKKHTTNNLTLGSRNKWIELYGNADTDSIEFKHSQSPIVTRLRAEQADGNGYIAMHQTEIAEDGSQIIKIDPGTHNVLYEDKTGFENFTINDKATEIKVEPTTKTLSYISGINDQDDNRLTIPYLTVDNAGHVVELGTKNFNIPHTYKHITLTEQSESQDFIEPSNGDQEADLLTDRLTFSTGNQWIEAKIDEDQLTFAHAPINKDSQKYWQFKATAHETDSTDKENAIISEGWNNAKKDGNILTIPTFEIDKAGHVVDSKTVDFYIPNNFREIKVANIEGSIDDNAVQNSETLTADTTIDAWTLASQNPWIRIAADPKTDKITIGHSHSSQLAHDFATDVVIDDDIDGVSEHSARDCVYTIPFVKTDNAGHIIGSSTKSIYIPYNYRNIVLSKQSTDETQMDVSDGKQEADITTDTFTFSTGNQWIRTRIDEDQITFAHALINKERKVNWQFIPEATDGWKYSDDGNKLTIPTFEIDNAGHVINNSTTDFYIPNNFRNIHLLAQSTDSTKVTASDTKVEMNAESIVDTFTFATGNKWVQTTGDETNDKITFSHILSDVAKDTYGTNDVTALTPQFGDTFLVPGYAVDEAGHITSSSTHTVKIPQNSYLNDDAEKTIANVITGMSLNQATGAITTTSQNVGTLALTGYTKLDATTTAAIQSDNTINEAFSILDNRIENEEKARVTAIGNLRMFNAIKVAGTRLEADSNADTLTIAAENDGIVLTPTDTDDSFTIGHKTGHQVTDGFYKLSTDAYGHVSSTTAVTLKDLTDLGVASNNSPTLTGVPTAPTAEEGTNTTQIATTAFANEAIKEATRLIWEDLKNNYNLVLKQPTITISQTVSEDKFSAQLVVNTPVAENDVYSYNWSTGETNNIIEVTENGTYTCVVTRTHNGYISEAESSIIVTEIIAPEEESPTI